MTRTPAQVFPPGEYLEEELDARGWTQEDFARILGKPLPTINRILKGKVAITPDTAKKIAAALGTSPEVWINLESMWQLHQAEEPAEEIQERAFIYNQAPIREMVRRGWIGTTQTPDDLREELRKHFFVDDLAQVPGFRAAARSSTKGETNPLSPEQWAWMCRCRHLSALVDAGRFRKAALRECVVELRRYMADPEEIAKVQPALAEAGVRLVVVQHLQATRIDGGALERNSREPVVALSLRFGRLDNFWFTLFHELAHVLNGDGITADEEVGQVGDIVDETEARANAMASEWLVPSEHMDSFIRRTSGNYTTMKIRNFARRMAVHPSIVAGHLRFRQELHYAQFTNLNTDVRDTVRASCISDGWGEAPSL